MKKLSIKLLLLFSILALFSSCISDDLDGCPADFALRFVYDKNPSGQDLLANIGQLNVYIYDEQGLFVKKESRRPSDLEAGNILRLQLDGARYTFVTWADNTLPSYNTYFNTDLASMHLELQAPNDQVATPPGMVYHALNTIDINADNTTTYPVSLMHNTHNITVAIKVPANLTPVAIGDFVVRITGANGDYNYDNTLRGSRALNYIQSYTTPATNMLHASSQVMRLFVNDNTRLDILDAAGQVIQTTLNNNHLTDILMQSPAYRTQEALDKETDFVINCELKTDNSGNVIIEITGVNDWELIENGGELG